MVKDNKDAERQTIIIPEKKDKMKRMQERCDKIRRQYNSPDLDNETAMKIYRLDVANKVLTSAALISGVVTAIDIIVPDPIPGIDEAVLTGVTTLLTTGATIVNSKIQSTLDTGNARLSTDDVNVLANQMTNIAKASKATKQPPVVEEPQVMSM